MTEAPRPWFRPRLDGLAPRVAAYLTIALLPLGLIALYQTREFQRETERRSELSLLGLTEQGATGIGQAIEQALGAGEALGVVSGLLDDPETCSEYLSRFVEGRDLYSFVGFLPASGPVTCSSADAPFEVDPGIDIAGLMAEPRVRVSAVLGSFVPGEDVLTVLIPGAAEQGEQGGFPGYLALSIPRDRIPEAQFGVSELRPLRLLTVSGTGEILTRQMGDAEELSTEDLLPRGRSLGDEVRLGGPRVFEAVSGLGEDQVYTITPLIPDVAYALAIWSPEQAGQGIESLAGSPLLFPLLMWATSLVVAFFAIHSLVIRRVTDLGLRMRRFGRNRSMANDPSATPAPLELREIEEAFRAMAASILQDEARMENAFRERGVLLREVHHRVKNNLQLISSIISMQVRRLPDPRVRGILRRLQDRVLTLASIYRSLYMSPDMGDVNAAPVLRAIVEQELRGSPDMVEAVLDIEDIVLDPDKVVPLSFLAAEAVSNALARAGAVEGRPSLSVTLHREGDKAVLRIANSLAGPPAPLEEPARGLGQHLIQAFAAQVGGPVETEVREGLYCLSVAFPIESHLPADEVESA
ncbi:sensor histidine kinase [Rubellimicrobium rubrum]|uniref:histidine kinase n=1 Tax=Rubellimicrobium rubrum TaxID=2585369 RepID=A0A5C4N5I6_9RHOB|nr:sensor histidine kinase [Rubellimicrobium rubrum]TNC52908.1 sensor histidine kinase [Rubellimicrobium rubrum]